MKDFKSWRVGVKKKITKENQRLMKTKRLDTKRKLHIFLAGKINCHLFFLLPFTGDWSASLISRLIFCHEQPYRLMTLNWIQIFLSIVVSQRWRLCKLKKKKKKGRRNDAMLSTRKWEAQKTVDSQKKGRNLSFHF